MINGIVVINKAAGYTSRDVVNKMCKIFNTKKIGHTGTLDPLATGVLVICIGKATKLVDMLTSETKEYIASMKLGIETDTLDISGAIIKEEIVNTDINNIKRALKAFIGKTTQEVPIFSAIKVNGKKLYEYARNNVTVELPKREINIEYIELLDFKDNIITFKTKVSKGTYIRSLIRDIAQNLGTCGTMLSLNRISQGEYLLNDSYTIDDIMSDNYKLISIKEVLKDCVEIIVDEKMYFKIKNAQIINKDFVEEFCLYLDEQKKEIAIYKEYEANKKMAKPFIMF